MLTLKLWRVMEGLSQEEAARRIGISQLTLSYLESGRLVPNEKLRSRLEAHFGRARAAEMLQPAKPAQEAVSKAARRGSAELEAAVGRPAARMLEDIQDAIEGALR